KGEVYKSSETSVAGKPSTNPIGPTALAGLRADSSAGPRTRLVGSRRPLARPPAHEPHTINTRQSGDQLGGRDLRSHAADGLLRRRSLPWAPAPGLARKHRAPCPPALTLCSTLSACLRP